jgi:NADPH:quinone reductase-like Zn-dependent oxidoreductase
VGNEGAGVVVATGPGAEGWLGATVSLIGGATYSRYRTLHTDQCLRLPEETTPRQGASGS